MTNLQITSKDSLQTMSSIEISKLTGKLHKNVIRDCENLIQEYQKMFDLLGSDLSSIIKTSTYKDLNNIDRPCYELSKQATLDLMTGYSLPLRHAINKRWQELENKPKLPANYIEALQSLIESEKVKQAALDQIETDKPKVEFAMAIKNSKGLSTVSDLAKCLGIGRNRMFYKLRDHSYLMKSNEPYQRFIDSGIFKYLPDDPFVDASGRSYQTYTTFITGKGMIVLEKKFRSENKNGLVIINGDVFLGCAL